jgi:serine/threonine protein kinase
LPNVKSTAAPIVDYYEILQVTPRATENVIQAAYRALAKIHHPDFTPDTQGQAMRLINEAYHTLSDPARRSAYDKDRTPETDKVFGDYKIIQQIASGGFGTTYLAEYLPLKEHVCLKHCHKVSPEYTSILMAEAKAIWNLRHYALPTIRGMQRMPDGSWALIMSYIPGPTIEQIVNKTGKIEPEHMAWIGQRILNALKYLHDHGVIHGDVKPQNIIIQPVTHQAALVDFGLAMVKPKRHDRSMGYTPRFAPPEEEEGRVLVPESDLYSFGMTLIYGLSGSTAHVERKQIPASVPQPFADFIKRLVVREVKNRPHWGLEDLCDTMSQVRVESFGRGHSNMKPLQGV